LSLALWSAPAASSACTATVRPLLLAHMRAVLSFCQVEQRCGAHGG